MVRVACLAVSLSRVSSRSDLISLTISQEQPHPRSKWPIILCVLVSFIIGFGVSFISRNTTPSADSRTQIADFRVTIPEGETVVTVTSRDVEGEQLGRLTIQRRGNTILGVPQIERRIAPRERLSPEDVAFFRREVGGEVSISGSEWERAN